MNHTLTCIAVVFALAVPAERVSAQDAVKAAPDQYKVELENDKVRVLRISYGPYEKSAMHSHPEGVAIFLTDGKGKFTLPDGTTQNMEWKAGDIRWVPESTHQPENTGDEAFSLIQIEMKPKGKKK